MKRYPIECGSIVISLAGRDEGRAFLVMQELDAEFVLVANGALRGVARPKKKRRKHLKPTGTIVQALRERLTEGAPVEDHEIRAWLKEIGG